jgi:hypothetical protein
VLTAHHCCQHHHGNTRGDFRNEMYVCTLLPNTSVWPGVTCLSRVEYLSPGHVSLLLSVGNRHTIQQSVNGRFKESEEDTKSWCFPADSTKTKAVKDGIVSLPSKMITCYSALFSRRKFVTFTSSQDFYLLVFNGHDEDGEGKVKLKFVQINKW